MKRDKVDAVFSNLVRLRPGPEHICEYCLKKVRTECAHIYGRRDRKLRWHPHNAVALCHYDHRRFTEHPVEFWFWLESYIGSGMLEMLRERHNDNRIKYTKADKEELYEHLKAEYQRMKNMRNNGEQGRIEFIAWD